MQQQKRQPILCNIIQYNEILYNTVQYHTIPCKIFTIITKTYWRLFANLCGLSYSGKAFFHHPSLRLSGEMANFGQTPSKQISAHTAHTMPTKTLKEIFAKNSWKHIFSSEVFSLQQSRIIMKSNRYVALILYKISLHPI